MRLIDGDALYAKLQKYEELARKWVLYTPSTLPFPTDTNPAYTRYLAQLNERTTLKHMIADAPTIAQPEIIHCRDCKHKYGSACDNFAEVWVSQNDYCSRAERKEDNNETN